jgi:hypothetical protein
MSDTSHFVPNPRLPRSRLGAGRRVLCLALLCLLAPAGDAQDLPAGLAASPLAERVPTPAGPLFELLGPERTAIDFEHRWDPPDEHRHLLGNGMAGGGVALGDADGDGRIDVYLTRPSGGSRLYRNLGGFRFEDVTDAAGLADGGAWGGGATFGDLDGDGDQDLVVCGYDSPLRLYVNQGDGTFRENAVAAGLEFTGAAIQFALADYDLDGDLDGYLLTNRFDSRDLPPEPSPGLESYRKTALEHPELYQLLTKPDGTEFVVRAAQFDRLYRNDGTGKFTDVTAQAGILGNDYGLSATWWDHDGDGLPDLYVSNDFYGPDRLYHNLGDGRFVDVAREVLPHTPWYSMGSDTGDINNDGRLDFMATDMSGNNHYKQKVAMGDMADAGWFLDSAEPRQYMRNAVYVNTGTYRFMEAGFLTGMDSSNWTWSIRFADLDEDGLQDTFITNGMTRDYFNSDLRDIVRRLPAKEQDRYWETTPELREANLAFRNLGELQFEDVSDAWGLGQVGVSFGLGVADLDGDGDLDVVINNFEEPVSVLANRSGGTHRVTLRLAGRHGNTAGIGAVVRVYTTSGQQMRYVTHARGYMSGADGSVHFGLGSDERIERLVVEWPSGHEQVFRNLPADRHYVVTEPAAEPPGRVAPSRPQPIFARTTGVVSVERPYNDYARQPLLPYKLSQLGPGLAIADIDGDGDEDYVLGGPAGRPIEMFRNDEQRRYEPVSQPAIAADQEREDMAPLFLDVDGDGDQDLYIVSGGVECEPGSELLADRLYLNDGKGVFTPAPAGSLPPNRDSGGVVVAADIDRDGDLDLFVGGRSIPGDYPEAPVSRLLRNEGGRFTDATAEISPELREAGMVTGAIWSDADGDGWIDLLVTHEWGPVRYWRNEGGLLVDHTEAAGLADRLGWWNGIAARDLDGDGDIDYLVTNNGLNSKYHATPDVPALIYYGAYDDSGKKQLIEAEYEDETLFPTRGKSCSTRAMPFLAERFDTFNDFAVASLSDIYTPECLANATEFRANTLESGVLINDGSGSFRFDPLPRLAQAAPGFGVVLTDVDGDGHADALVAQNFYGPQPETGHMDGGVGLYLRGRGDGRFDFVWPDESGLLIPGDGKSLAVTDFNGDGWVDVLVGLNDGPLHAFFNLGQSAGRPFVVKLDGRPGNPTAVGAHVTVHLADGSSQSAEVAAGGGYLSQSSAALTFGLGLLGWAQSVDVRWPDGERSTHRVSRGAGRVLLQQP